MSDEVMDGGAEQAADNSVQDRDFDAEAREMGWVPEAEYRGPKEKWKPAQQFVEDGEKILPIVRSQLQKTRDELTRKEQDFAKRLERMEKVNSAALAAAQRQHQVEVERLKAAQRQAVSEGNEAEYDRLERQKEKLEREAPRVDEPQADPAADLATRQDNWRKANTWFDEDFEMQDYAIRYSDFHGRKNPHLSFEENMKAVEAEVRKKFPERFGGRPAANGHAAVDGGGHFAGIPPRKKSPVDGLPAEARVAGERFVKQGLFKSLEDYAKEYLNG